MSAFDYDYISLFSENAGSKGKGTLRFNKVNIVEGEDKDRLYFTYISASTSRRHIADFPLNRWGVSYTLNNGENDAPIPKGKE